MAMQKQTIPRVTPPDMPSLTATLAPLLAVANAGSFHLRHENGAVVIEMANFTGVNMTAVTAAVAAAPNATAQSAAQADIDAMSIFEKAVILTLIDQLNVIRSALPTPLAAITPAQALAAVRAKAGTL